MRSIAIVIGFVAALSACSRGYILPETRGIDASKQVEGGKLSVEHMGLEKSVCTGLDLQPEYQTLDESSVVNFLKARGLPTRLEKARADLMYVEVQVNPENDEWIRLRVAVLASPMQAGRELSDAIGEHGKGSWGIHRSNLAVLGPKGSVENIVKVMGKTKLSCWGVLTIGDGDDAFAIRGNYREL